MLSSAVLIRIWRICVFVKLGLAALTRAAMAATCGAAADVPKNGRNPGVLALTPSAAVTSGFRRVVPPLVPYRRFPGVIAVPFGLKKILRGPSELKVSTGLAAPVNGLVPKCALLQAVAATVTVFWPALCPKVEPVVAIDKRPRLVSTRSARAAPANRTI